MPFRHCCSRRRALGLSFAAGLAMWDGRPARAQAGGRSLPPAARSGAEVPTVVELYTSEGCNSCPPADAWLSSLRAGDALIVAAFHVDYWDRLGWKDRFADPAYTGRQSRLQASTGARFVYTPQLVVDGRDWRGWPDRPLPARSASTMSIEAERDAAGVRLRLSPRDDRPPPARVGGWWAVLESGHESRAAAGENAGRLLHHDHVVRAYGELAVADGRAPRELSIAWPSAAAEAGRPRRFAVVLTDAAGGRPVAALSLPG